MPAGGFQRRAPLLGLIVVRTALVRGRQSHPGPIVEPGITGCLVDTVQEAIDAIPDLLAHDRHLIRKRFEQKFSAGRMARDYTKFRSG